MNQRRPAQRARYYLVTLLATVIAGGWPVERCRAQIAITSNPIVTMSPVAPLAGTLSFSTDVPTQVSLQVHGPNEAWVIDSHEFQLDHPIPLLGFAPGSQYLLDSITLQTQSGQTSSLADSFIINTNPLPDNFPELNVKIAQPTLMEPGLTLIPARGRTKHGDYTFALDANGIVRWYIQGELQDVHQLANGNLLSRGPRGARNSIREIDILGNDVRVWRSSDAADMPGSVPVLTTTFHHDVVQLPNGNFLTLARDTQLVNNFPSSESDPNAPRVTADVMYDPIIEFSPQGDIVHSWNMLDIVDPTRIGYGVIRDEEPHDWAHNNAIIHDPHDDTIIVSMRKQNAVVKFARSTGELVWILGPHKNWGPSFQQYLFDPKGQPFDWAYYQHAPKLLPNGNILLFDNGNFRASPFDPTNSRKQSYSRAVEFELDEQAMEITQVWEYGTEAEDIIFSPTRSEADWLSTTDNILITFSHVTHINGIWQSNHIPQIIEVDRNGQKVFDVAVIATNGNASVYRSERISSLYPLGYQMTAAPLPSSVWLGLGLLAALAVAHHLRGRIQPHHR